VELPHLTLQWRRMGRGPLRRALAFAAVYALVATCRLLLPQVYFAGAFMGYVEDLLILGGNFTLYFAIAETMAGLARDPGRAALEDDMQPAWHLSPLASARAVLGTTASALLTGLPLALVLTAYLLLLHGWSGYTLLSLWLFTLRLPHFALACGCIVLAARSETLARYLPGGIALAAALVQVWGYYDPCRMLPAPGQLTLPSVLAQYCIAVGLALLGLLLVPAVRAAGSAGAVAGRAAVLVALVVAPLLLGAGALVNNYFAADLYHVLSDWHLAFAYTTWIHLFPGVAPVAVVAVGTHSVDQQVTYWFCGQATSLATAMWATHLILAFSLLIWYAAAVASMDSARRHNKA
jgi:hypothetical protein